MLAGCSAANAQQSNDKKNSSSSIQAKTKIAENDKLPEDTVFTGVSAAEPIRNLSAKVLQMQDLRAASLQLARWRIYFGSKTKIMPADYSSKLWKKAADKNPTRKKPQYSKMRYAAGFYR